LNEFFFLHNLQYTSSLLKNVFECQNFFFESGQLIKMQMRRKNKKKKKKTKVLLVFRLMNLSSFSIFQCSQSLPTGRENHFDRVGRVWIQPSKLKVIDRGRSLMNKLWKKLTRWTTRVFY
jgi:hypothetical protein